MNRPPITPYLWAAFIMLLATAAAAAEEDEPALPEEGIMRQISSEPGHLDYSPKTAFFNEQIETSNGQLSISHEELSIPLNGGRALRVIRSYNSHSNYKLPPEDSRLGVGWTMHMGRVIFPARYYSRLCNPAGAHMSNQFDNPVIELPDGGRKMFFLDKEDARRFITSDNWKLECDHVSGFVFVMSPDGTRYDMDVVHTFDNSKPGYLYPSQITDRHGNVTRIRYGPSYGPGGFVISRIMAEDVTVDFVYHGQTHNLEEMRSSDGRVWTYSYAAAAGGALSYLTRVEGPGDYIWEYDYFSGVFESEARHFNLSKVVTPGGASILYDYALFQLNSFDLPVSVVARRSVEGNATDATWHYAYERYADTMESSSDGQPIRLWLNKTTITGPSNVEAHFHIADKGEVVSSGAIIFPHPLVQRVKVRETREGEERRYRHQFRVFSHEKYGIVDGTGRFLGSTLDIVAPLLVYSEHTRDGRTASVAYTEHDRYGNPGKITEYASVAFPGESPAVPVDRTTTLAYRHLTEKWILGLKASEVTGGAHSISRQFDNSGNPLSETIDGVTTSFLYTAGGDLASQTDAFGNTTHYLDYYRGQARRVEFADGSAITRQIDSQGQVTQRTDEVGRTTVYAYDSLGRLTRLQPPSGNVTLIAQAFGETLLTRGAYRETVRKDGFGRVMSVLKEDVQRGFSIRTSVERDAYGRVIRENFPNSDEGKAFTYDALGRLLSTTVNGTLLSQNEYTADGVRHTDGNGNVTLTAFRHVGSLDGPGRVYQVDNAEGRTLIVHNLAGNVQKIYQGNEESGYFSRLYTYDTRHHLKSIFSSESGLVTYEHDLLGNLVRIGRENGTGIANLYDSRNRLVESRDLATDTVSTHEYHADGRVRQEARGEITVDFTYEQNGLLESMTVHFSPDRSYRFDYSYDHDHNLAALRYPSGNSVDYAYDALRRIVSARPYVEEATYYPSGNRKSVRYGNGRQISYREDAWRRLHEMESHAGDLGVHFRYAYDGNQNLAEIGDLLNPAQTLRMDYDKVNRLLRVTQESSETRYAYDLHNNITAVYRDEVLEKEYGYREQQLQRLTDASGRQLDFEYDAAGMMTFIGDRDSTRGLQRGETLWVGNSLSWDSFGNLAGYRHRYATVGMLLDGTLALTHRDDDAGPEFLYTPSNLLAMEQYGPSRSYHLHSPEGDLLMSEQEGAVIEQIYFDGDVVATRELPCLSRGLDSDGDTIEDCEERKQGLDPDNSDTDGDTIDDGVELEIGTDPLVDDALVDADGDSLSNLDEFILGTDLYQSDTDGDGADDGEERLWNTSPHDSGDVPLLRLTNRFSFSGMLADTPAVDTDGNLYLLRQEQGFSIMALSPSGDVIWSRVLQFDCWLHERLVVYGPVIDEPGGKLLVSLCGSVQAFALGSGEPLWSYGSASENDFRFGKLALLGGKTAVEVRDVNGIQGRLLVLDAGGQLEWEQPLEHVRSLVADGDVLYAASCHPDGLTVSAYSAAGEKRWENRMQQIPCYGRNIAVLPMSIGLAGEIYLLNGYRAVILNRDGTQHSVVQADLAYEYSANIAVGTHGRAVVQLDDGQILSMPGGSGLAPYANAPMRGTATGTLAWMYDGSLLSASHQFFSGEQGYTSMHQLVRIAPDGTSREQLQDQYSSDNNYHKATPPLPHASGFYYVMQKKYDFEILDVSTQLLGTPDSIVSPWPMRDADPVRSRQSPACGGRDSDSDAIPDCYEAFAGLDRDSAHDATEDADGDGLGNLDEYERGTHPFMQDSDGDSIQDSEEISLGLDPLSSNIAVDSDGDGVPDTLEFLAGFTPVDADSRPTGGEIIWQHPVDTTRYASPYIGNRYSNGIFTSGSKVYDHLGRQLSSREFSADVIWISSWSTYYIDEAGELRYIRADKDSSARQSGLQDVVGAAFSTKSRYTVYYYTGQAGELVATQNEPFEPGHKWTIDVPKDYPVWEGTPVGDATVHTAPVLNGGKQVSAAAGKLFLQVGHGSGGEAVAGELLDGAVRHPMAADRFGSIALGTESGSVYSINNGDVQWKNSRNAPVTSGIAIGYGGIVIAGDDEGVLRAIDTDGTTLWWRDLGDAISGTPVVGASGHLYVFAGADLVAVDGLGHELWRTAVDPAPFTSPRMDQHGILYLTSTTRGLTAVYTGEQGVAQSDWPMEAHDGGATGNLNGGRINEDESALLEIQSPAEGAVVPAGEPLRLVADAYDEEDGNLSDLIEWWKINDSMEQLGLGRRLSVTLPPGEYRIAAFVRDAGLRVSSDSVSFTVSGDVTGLDLVTDVGSPAIAGQEVYLTADIDNLEEYEFKFRIKRAGERRFRRLRAFSDIPVHVLDTSTLNGKYLLQVIARNKGDNSLVYRKAVRYWVNLPSPVTALDVAFPSGRVLQEGEKLLMAASASSSGAADYEYSFDIRQAGGGRWQMLRDYSPDPSLETLQPAGQYRIRVRARRAGSEDKPVVARRTFWVNSPHALDTGTLDVTEINSGFRSRPSFLIEAEAWSSSADWNAAGLAVEYQFRIRFPGDERYRLIRDYDETSFMEFTVPNGVDYGDADLLVKARVAGTRDKPLRLLEQIWVYDISYGFGLHEVPTELY